MNKISTRVLALLMALALMFCLAACDEEDSSDKKGKDGGNVVDIDPTDDPNGFFTQVLAATNDSVAERYSGSPLASFKGSGDDSGALAFELTVSEDGETADLGGTLYMDASASKLKLDAYLGYNGDTVDGSLYYDPDFVGVSVPMILGDDTFYGMMPHDFYKQAVSSPMSQYMSSSDLDVFRQLDDMINALSDMEPADVEKYVSDIQAACDDFMSSLDFEAEAKRGGYIITTTVDSRQLADLMDDVMSIYMDYMRSTMEGLAQLTGESVDFSDYEYEMDEVVRQIRDLDITFDVEYTTSEDEILGLEITGVNGNGEELRITADYTDGISAEISIDGEVLMTMKSDVSSGRGSYDHTITIEVDGETLVINTVWEDNDLAVSVSVDGDEYIKVTGELGISGSSFYLNNGVLTLNDGYEYMEIPFSLSYESGARVPSPSSTRNIFEMSEDELQELVYNIAYLMN